MFWKGPRGIVSRFSGDEFEFSHKMTVTDTTKLKSPSVEGNMQDKISVVWKNCSFCWIDAQVLNIKCVDLTILCVYTSHKKFMNTSTSAKSAVIIKFQGRYLKNQISYAVEILNDFILHGPLTEHHIAQNKKNKIPINHYIIPWHNFVSVSMEVSFKNFVKLWAIYFLSNVFVCSMVTYQATFM